jgi:hypothetical protein
MNAQDVPEPTIKDLNALKDRLTKARWTERAFVDPRDCFSLDAEGPASCYQAPRLIKSECCTPSGLAGGEITPSLLFVRSDLGLESCMGSLSSEP